MSSSTQKLPAKRPLAKETERSNKKSYLPPEDSKEENSVYEELKSLIHNKETTKEQINESCSSSNEDAKDSSAQGYSSLQVVKATIGFQRGC